MSDRLALASLEWTLRCMAERSGIPLPEMPHNYPGRFGDDGSQDPLELGALNSGGATLPAAENSKVPILNIGLPQAKQNMGLACVHISVSDADNSTPAAGPNCRVLCDIVWGGPKGGGSATIDATQGSKFSVGGATAINITARMVKQSGAVAFAPGRPKKVEAVVQWSTGIPARPAYMTSEALLLAKGVESARMSIPSQASAVRVFNDGGFTVTLKLYPRTDAVATFRQVYQSDFTTVAGAIASVPIVAGAEEFTLTSASAPIAFAAFDLWL